MKRFLITTLSVAAALCLTNCHSKDTGLAHVQPGTQREIESSPVWKLSLATSCDGDQVKCVGAYGFSILANGSYQVGPGPGGQILTGKLKDDEFKAIESALDSVINPAYPIDIPEAAGQETCSVNTAINGKESIFFNRRGQDMQLVHSAGTQFCFKTVSLSEADTLQKTVHALATTYYVLPFPDACVDAQSELQALYPSVTECSEDSDCAYVDNAYTPVAPGEMQFIVTDDCTMASPLPAGNRLALIAKQSDLLNARLNTRTVCGPRFQRAACSQVSGFQSTLALPVCLEGSCRVNPSIR